MQVEEHGGHNEHVAWPPGRGPTVHYLHNKLCNPVAFDRSQGHHHPPHDAAISVVRKFLLAAVRTRRMPKPVIGSHTHQQEQV
jgi:hypothetical protein